MTIDQKKNICGPLRSSPARVGGVRERFATESI
jgi:hypothetical protein